MRGFPSQRLDGSMPNDLRVRAVDHYNAADSTDYEFLISIRAGGLGINLATADTVSYLTQDWNPHKKKLRRDLVRIASGKQRTLKYFDFSAKKLSTKITLNGAKRKSVLEHLVIHGVEGDEQYKGCKELVQPTTTHGYFAIWS
jgi:chromodomain-helicase-DNA-binding protein 1